METMRVFAALTFPPEQSRVLVQQFKRLDLKYPEIRPQSVDKMHITLRFWGQLAVVDLPIAIRVLEALAADIHGFSLTIGAAKIYKAALVVDTPSDYVSEVYTLLQKHVAAHELDTESAARFSPHITMARYRGALPVDDAQRFEQWQPESILHITELVLFQSETSAEGSIFTPLKQWPL